MEKQYLLFSLAVVIFGANGCPVGREFITAFMTNYQTTLAASPKLAITAQEFPATVTVQVTALGFSQTVKIDSRATRWITLPSKTELSQPGSSGKTVLITSNSNIAVVASHIKAYTGDSSVIFPTSHLGKDYVAFTPNVGVSSMDKLLAIINGNEKNVIEILPHSSMSVRNMKKWKRREKVTITLAPYEVYQLQSRHTFTGARIKSQLPVAVLGGHQCSRFRGTCEHVYEQLMPVESLSTNYLVPAMHLSSSRDEAYVVATEDKTIVTLSQTGKPKQRKLSAGDVLQLNIAEGKPAIVDSNKKVMVMYYSENRPFDEYLTNILPSLESSGKWSVEAQDSYQNTLVIVAESESVDSIVSSPKPQSFKWRKFPTDKRYVWSVSSIGSSKGPFTVSGDSIIAVYVYGGKTRHGYATTGVCSAGFTPPKPVDPCEDVKCREKEKCQKGVCVPTSEATCQAVGDPHYRTFDGKRFDFQGTCTYKMVTTQKNLKGLVPFTILTKNNHRGSTRVSYVRTVTVIVYNHTVTIGHKRGEVELDGEIVYLPVSIEKEKIQVVQRGRYAVLTTDFSLEVKYDWNMKFYTTVPSSYFSSLGGLCGNYNGNRKDEFSDPKGQTASSIVKFAQSWKEKDNDLLCHDDCQGKCPTCTEAQQIKYGGVKYCGLMAQAKGPFAQCHKALDPDMYTDNCVYDICINKGRRNFLCDNMEGYADACLAEGIKLTGNWRKQANCPIECPKHSHYEACGTACAATCADRDAPAKCKVPCVEGCQCDKGYVLSGDECVPEKKCGCVYQGFYHPPGKTFWADKTCTKQCTCNPGTGKVDCANTKCKKSEVCDVRKGVRGCYSVSYGTCRGVGDPHYRTFDGKKFNFQGTCTYYLSKFLNTSDSSLVPFEVLVQNENRGRNKAVSFTKSVEITVYGYTIVMNKENRGKVMVNNLYVNLPLELEDGKLSIFRNGYFGIVKTDFDLTLKFNWQSLVTLTLPSSYQEMLGGLCGNWNGKNKDDMTLPDKSIVKNPTIFGTAWKAREDAHCSNDCKGAKCQKCDDAEKSKRYTKPCSILTDKKGPFRNCHDKVNPEEFYDDCVYDMCMEEGHSSALCNALASYTAACQDASAVVENWRTDSFCPPSCQANSHYEVCPTGCPQTCSNLEEPAECEGTPCIEGCVCDEGFVLSDGECVPLEKCGCVMEGQYYTFGQVFFPNGQCKEKCTCEQNGNVKCDSGFSCGPNEKCQVQDGVQACFPEGKASCSVSGSGYYESFDGKSFTVQGDCIYKMVEVDKDEDEDKTSFSVLVHQTSSSEDTLVTREITIQVSDYEIIMLPGLVWEIRVNAIRTNLPLVLNEGSIRAYQNGLYIILETDFGLKVMYDTVSIVTVEVPSTYKDIVSGLCGNYNDKKADDFRLPDGKLAQSVEKFAEGWVLAETDMKCQTGCGSKCTNPDKDKQTEAETACKILTSGKGPFSPCHATVPPKKYFDDCVKDVAAQQDSQKALCQHLQNYVAICQTSGGSVNSWRNETSCPLKCQENSHYELCADTCSPTCASLSETVKCPRCQEGCECDDGFAFDGAKCKPLGDCGCVVDGRFYTSGETVISENCEEACSCKAGEFSCKASECSGDDVCVVEDGVTKCSSPDPCENNPCREKETCVVKDKKTVCVPQSVALCWAMGDPQYQTFDGKRFSFQGTCSYTLVQTTGEDSTLTPFRIITKNGMHGGSRGAYIKSVKINIKGHDIVVVFGNRDKVQVDGQQFSLPVNLDSDNISITQFGIQGILRTNFGLELRFDWAELFLVNITSSYYDNLAGMCGNYNDNQEDDLSTPNGEQTASTTEWVKSWSISDGDRLCWHSPACSPGQQELYKSKTYCGLFEDENGPFSVCHDKVPPAKWASDCFYYLCQEGRNKGHCQTLAAYENACKKQSAEVSPEWRQLTNCSG